MSSLFDNTLENNAPKAAQQMVQKEFPYLDELNEVQRNAAKTTEGAVMVIAGPGSGKTRVLTYRITHIINKGTPPYRILSLTFTNKAASEMKERIEKIVGVQARSLWMGTFHSIFSRILRIEAKTLGYPSNFTIYDTTDAKSLIKTIIKERNLDSDLYTPNLVYNRISNAKNNLLSAQAYLGNEQIRLADERAKRPQIGKIYQIYEKRCKQAGAMDFDDLLVKMYVLLYHHPEMADKYQKRFRYILIDEFQDTNYAQYAIVKKLSEKHRNICIVGDDAQSIYAFRGATIQNILNFEKDYPKLNKFKLEQNYRSTQNIVQLANKVISHNQEQLAKQIWTENEEGDIIKLFQAESDKEEAKMVSESIYVEKLRNHYKNEDFAILYRTNAQSRSFEDGLRKRNIPYRVYGGLSFYQRKEVKDLMAYLRLVVNHYDEEALKRIINYPTRGIGQKTFGRISSTAAQLGVPMWDVMKSVGQYALPKRTQESIRGFVRVIELFTQSMNKMNAFELAQFIGRTTKIVQLLHNDKSVEGLSRYENIQELFNSIQEFVVNKQAGKQEQEEQIPEIEDDIPIEEAFPTVETTSDSLGTYLQEVSLLTDMDNDKDDNNKVKLMTIHAAKGLEFPCVYVVGLEEGLFPSQTSIQKNELEEERRLFYVAVTRAESKLFLSKASCRYRFGKVVYGESSRFLSEIPLNQVKVLGRRTLNSSRNSSNYQQENNNARFSSSVKQTIKDKQKRFNKGNSPVIPSNFKPSPPHLIKVNMDILHTKFGKGRVTLVEGNGDKKMASIDFTTHGTKRILLKFAKLMILQM